MKNIAVAYCRVSTAAQANEGISMQMQAEKAKLYCQLNNLELCGIYGDPAISGKSTTNRPGLQAVIKMIREGKVQHLITYKLDRLSRSTLESLQLIQLIDEAGATLHSISESLNTQTPTGRFTMRIICALGEMERDQLGERTRSALQFKKSQGERLGRPRHGLRVVDGELVADPDKVYIRSRVFQLKGQGYTLREISRALATEGYTVSKSRVQQILRAA
jgi:site-specific DNA recombinase